MSIRASCSCAILKTNSNLKTEWVSDNGETPESFIVKLTLLMLLEPLRKQNQTWNWSRRTSDPALLKIKKKAQQKVLRSSGRQNRLATPTSSFHIKPLNLPDRSSGRNVRPSVTGNVFWTSCDSWAELSAPAGIRWTSLHRSPTGENTEKALGSQVCYDDAQCLSATEEGRGETVCYVSSFRNRLCRRLITKT